MDHMIPDDVAFQAGKGAQIGYSSRGISRQRVDLQDGVKQRSGSTSHLWKLRLDDDPRYPSGA